MVYFLSQNCVLMDSLAEKTAHLLQCLSQDRLVFTEASQDRFHLCFLLLKLLHRGLQEPEFLFKLIFLIVELLGCAKLSILLLLQALESQ